MSIESIQKQFNESAAVQQDALELLAPAICAGIDTILSALVDNHKVLACGSGGSGALAQYFAAMLTNRYERERPELAAMALNADSVVLSAMLSDVDFSRIFAKQVLALGQAGDVLLAISTSGDNADVLEAVHAAHERDMIVVALTGSGGGKLLDVLSETDVHISVAYARAVRVQEAHLLTIHCLCDGIDTMLLGEN
jgi:D-sedoheptulose 7-phosphate isomerase